jgi:signal transduction histidine kinase
MDSLGIVTRELRALLATCIGFSDLLLSHEWPRSQQRQFLETMRSEGQHASLLLHNLLDYQRMESNGVQLAVRPTNVAALAQYAVSVVARGGQHRITLDCPSALPEALIEPDRIQQVLANLLSNARNFSPTGGEIKLSVRVIEGMLEVAVSDVGLGLPAEALSLVFEPFYRVDNTSHRDIKGGGLGLTLCRRIVEGHGGQIWAESRGLNLGARVSFTVPVYRQTSRAERADSSAANNTRTICRPQLGGTRNGSSPRIARTRLRSSSVKGSTAVSSIGS